MNGVKRIMVFAKATTQQIISCGDLDGMEKEAIMTAQDFTAGVEQRLGGNEFGYSQLTWFTIRLIDCESPACKFLSSDKFTIVAEFPLDHKRYGYLKVYADCEYTNQKDFVTGKISEYKWDEEKQVYIDTQKPVIDSDGWYSKLRSGIISGKLVDRIALDEYKWRVDAAKMMGYTDEEIKQMEGKIGKEIQAGRDKSNIKFLEDIEKDIKEDKDA